MRAFLVLLCIAVAQWPGVCTAQQYRARIDATAQSVTFRGLRADSIAVANVVTGSTGGPETPDGFAVTCTAATHCFYFREGPRLRAVPVVVSASATVWGFGIEGLSVRASGRLHGELGDSDAWPGPDDVAQLLEGYVEYQRGDVIARGGRQLVASRLELIGFDGGWARMHIARASLDVTAYGGWGLGQASAVTAANPALNPLDEWRPRDRQHVGGAELAWTRRSFDAHAEYRREIDPRDGNFVSERAAMSASASISAWRASAGFDYNLAEGHVGSADATMTLVQPRYTASLGARRYRPYFSLWTLWGAFSPVPYHAVHASAHVRATERISLFARGERYEYEDADVSTALVRGLEDRGWRANTGASASVGDRWRVDANYAIEFGPGAASRFLDGAVEYSMDRAVLAAYGGTFQRPLEFRHYDARGNWFGFRADVDIGNARRVWADVSVVGDDRDRPDAGGVTNDQVRLRSGVSMTFGSNVDRAPLPRAR